MIAGVEAVTKREGEAYPDFVARAGANPTARSVKIADLEDNMDMSRLPLINSADEERLERYRRALTMLRAL